MQPELMEADEEAAESDDEFLFMIERNHAQIDRNTANGILELQPRVAEGEVSDTAQCKFSPKANRAMLTAADADDEDVPSSSAIKVEPKDNGSSESDDSA